MWDSYLHLQPLFPPSTSTVNLHLPPPTTTSVVLVQPPPPSNTTTHHPQTPPPTSIFIIYLCPLPLVPISFTEFCFYITSRKLPRSAVNATLKSSIIEKHWVRSKPLNCTISAITLRRFHQRHLV